MEPSNNERQVWLARVGGCPCIDCKCCTVDENGCCSEQDCCKAWDVFCNQY